MLVSKMLMSFGNNVEETTLVLIGIRSSGKT